VSLWLKVLTLNRFLPKGESYVQQIIKGGIIAIAVACDVMSKNRETASQLGGIGERSKEKA
jgi:ribose/xylose/arabinose/galactoside ABC-type transport system permease subunit